MPLVQGKPTPELVLGERESLESEALGQGLRALLPGAFQAQRQPSGPAAGQVQPGAH